MASLRSEPKVRRTQVLAEDHACSHPRCGVVVEAGESVYHARLRAGDYYCSPSCRERHTRLLIQTKRRETPEQREYERVTKLRSKYGISADDWDRLYDLQLGRCPICLIALVETTVHVDHDHETDEVRGLLCKHCNPGLGYFKDDPAALRRAAAYLEAQRAGVWGEVTDSDVD